MIQRTTRTALELPIEKALVRFANRRAHPRRRVAAAVDFTSDSNFYSGISQDLSEGGVFVATHALLPRGQQVELHISMPDGPLRVTGEVRWVRECLPELEGPVGMGIKFLDLSGRQRQRLQRFVASRDTLLYED